MAPSIFRATHPFSAVEPTVGFSLELAATVNLALLKGICRPNLQEVGNLFRFDGVREDPKCRVRLNARWVRVVIIAGVDLRHNHQHHGAGRVRPEI